MRLKSEIWVKAYLRRCTVNGAMAMIARHGDDDAGAIFIKIARGDRMAAVFVPAPAGLDDADFDRRWVAGLGGKFLADDEVERSATFRARQLPKVPPSSGHQSRQVWLLRSDPPSSHQLLVLRSGCLRAGRLQLLRVLRVHGGRGGRPAEP